MWDTYGDVIRQLEQEGFVGVEADRVFLTRRGVAVADSVFERFIV